MIKLKDLLKEGSPGFEDRQFGDPLPTLKSIAEKHQSKKVITEDVETAVDMLMKRWNGVVRYWEDIDEIWKDNKKIPKIIVKYKRQWEKIINKMTVNAA